jgi:hypothetical protein
MTFLHLGAHSGSLLSPEWLAVIFPALLVLGALALRPGTPVNRLALAGYRLASMPVRVWKRGEPPEA